MKNLKLAIRALRSIDPDLADKAEDELAVITIALSTARFIALNKNNFSKRVLGDSEDFVATKKAYLDALDEQLAKIAN